MTLLLIFHNFLHRENWMESTQHSSARKRRLINTKKRGNEKGQKYFLKKKLKAKKAEFKIKWRGGGGEGRGRGNEKGKNKY
jgi:hypothetical protein